MVVASIPFGVTGRWLEAEYLNHMRILIVYEVSTTFYWCCVILKIWISTES